MPAFSRVPDSAQVTVPPDQAAVDDFLARTDKCRDSERRMSNRRMSRLAAAVAALVLVAGCGQAQAGSALPKGEDAANYVSAKFASTLETLSEEFTGSEQRKSKLDKLARIDDKSTDSTITAVQFGRPAGRLAKNHSNKDSTEYLDSYHPAGSPVEYTLLGPRYASLAPTPWISEPYTGGDLNGCFWSGYQDVCKMLQAVSDSVGKARAAKKAKSLPDGSVELSAEVPLGIFLDNRVIVFPDRLLSSISAEMRTGVIPARVVLDPRGKLKLAEMNGKVSGNGHEVEIRMTYQLLDAPTAKDLPSPPAPAEVTVLADQAAVDDFYRRMGEVQNG
jgi:hypothetical protein